jgi:UDP-glucose 4-epimerase
MKYLVTGGAGFIGSHLVDSLIADNHEVIVIDNESSKAAAFFYWNNKCINYKQNICDYSACNSIFERHKPDIIFHLAAESNIQSSIIDPMKTVNSNVVGTANMLELSYRHNVKRFVFSSTSAIYGLKNDTPSNESMSSDCLNQYSASKFAGEEFCKMYTNLYGLQTVILRYFNVYGERQPSGGQYAPVMGIFLRQKKNNEPMTIFGDGEQRRDFVHVSDVVAANIISSTFNPPDYLVENDVKYVKYHWGQVYNVGSGINYSINEIAKMIDGDVVRLPAKPGESRISLANITKIKNHMNWKPKTTLEEWIKTKNDII